MTIRASATTSCSGGTSPPAAAGAQQRRQQARHHRIVEAANRPHQRRALGIGQVRPGKEEDAADGVGSVSELIPQAGPAAKYLE